MPICAGKTKFAAQGHAQQVATAPPKRGKPKKPQLFAYQCPVCHCWHLSRSRT